MKQGLYKLLLRLYPRQVREEFGDEMMAVFRAAEHDGGGLWFLFRECGGMLRGAARERTFAPSVAPALIGVAVAAAAHWTIYGWLGGLTSRVTMRLNGPLQHNEQMELGIMALAALLCVIPLIVLASRQIQDTQDRNRLRPTR